MPLIHIILVLLLVGVLLWAINQLPMIDGNIKMIINVVVLILVILWVLQVLLGVSTLRLYP